MKKSKLIILATSLFLGISSITYAVNSDASANNQGVQKYRAVDSAEALLYTSENLLKHSWVVSNLKNCDDPIVKERYENAKKIRRDAAKAYQAGDAVQARHLALESIRVVSSAIGRHNTGVN